MGDLEVPKWQEEEERLQFYAAIGEAITTWAEIEGNLFDLYARLLKSNHYQALSAAYHSVINFNSRLKMVDAAATYTLTRKRDIKEWSALLKKDWARSQAP